MITGTDLLQISRARKNMNRADLEVAGVIDRGEAGDKAWSIHAGWHRVEVELGL